MVPLVIFLQKALPSV